jgi:GNAT superfamily N-acetyltransferase
MTSLSFHPLTSSRWDDFAALFGERGACAGCWCMFPLLARKAWEAGKGEGNREAMRERVRSGVVPGLLAYEGDAPIGWIALAPRETYPLLERSRIMAPYDDKPVWSVVCFFIDRERRGKGLTVELLHAAADYAHQQGARVLEGYPVDPEKRTAPAFAWHGTAAAFRAAGFEEVERRSPTRPLMRRTLG